ncbi:ATP-dependent DNA helicase Q1-like isoform X1 [Ptychodera flava]|uniref:ATP-dependent DNA helicase Q1-like isoform X1 n=1 Tax=Ptychodera flava TaxID=63121 RepID=UPI00396A4087
MSVTAELKGYFSQLNGVEDQLKAVESQIEELLDKQQQLHTKKRHLEREIAKIQKGGSTSMGSNFSRKDFPWSKKLTELRESVFKMTDFRPHQLETINATLSGRDVILIMPTGGGKSLCFQLPALVSKGITLVVSPLISLMEDQLMALEAFGINSTTLNASSSKEEKNSVHAAMLDAKSDLKILYVTPEKISKSKMFMSKLEKTHKAGRLSRIVIDEVHCCSQWGHDFRPDYKILGILKRQFPEVPLLGLTATATQHILEDVKNLLNVPYCTVLRASYDRPNLYYEVRRKPRKHEQFLEEVSNLLKGKFKGQSGIVYCFSKKEAEKVADDLKQRGIRALPYHADLDHKSRSYVHRQWTTGSIQAVVATVAFGMGIDKPDVRFVIHHTMSKSMENYYQESGRAGRDGKPAYCILYYGFSDIFRLSTMVFTETQVALENLYNMVRYCTDQQKCRRSLIARHFGESRDFTKCDRMCDHCSATEDGESCQVRDVTSQCKAIYSILEKTSRLDKKITANKLTDVLMKKGGTSSLQVKDLKLPPMSEEKYEMIVTHLLLECYLRQDFHFTPYSTISYIVPGSKEKLITAMGERVEVCLPSKSQKVSELPQLNVSRSKTVGSGKHKESSHSTASESSRVVRKRKKGKAKVGL